MPGDFSIFPRPFSWEPRRFFWGIASSSGPSPSGSWIALSAVYALEIYPKNEHFGKDEKAFWLGIKDPGREDALARFNVGVNNLFVDEKKALNLFDGILSRPDHPLYKMLRTRIYEELAIFYTVKKDFPKAESILGDLLKSGETQSLNFYFNYSYFLAFSGKRQEGEQLVLGLIRQFPRNHFVFLHAAKFYLIVQDYGRAGALYAEDFKLFRNRQSDSLAQQAAALQQKAR